MALHLDPQRREPFLRDAERTEWVGAERRSLRPWSRTLAEGALICPSCGLPLSIGRPLGVGHPIRCGYCDHESRARDFLVPDVVDTRANEASIVARLE